VKAARMTGASDLRIFWTLALPLDGPAALRAAADVFAETMLEVAVALWIVGRLERCARRRHFVDSSGRQRAGPMAAARDRNPVERQGGR